MRHLQPLVSLGTGRKMYGVELYGSVRLVFVQVGLSPHEAGREFGFDLRTVKKMLSYSAPPGYRRTKRVRRPELDGFTDNIDAILATDMQPCVPHRARRPARGSQSLPSTTGTSYRRRPWDIFSAAAPTHSPGQIFVLLRVVSERSMARDGCSS